MFGSFSSPICIEIDRLGKMTKQKKKRMQKSECLISKKMKYQKHESKSVFCGLRDFFFLIFKSNNRFTQLW